MNLMKKIGLNPDCKIPISVHHWYTVRNFSCMVITSCMSVAVSGFGAEWLLDGNVLCNILMACYRCFCRIVHGTHMSVPSICVRGGGSGHPPWFEKFRGKRKLLKNPE